jgi:pyruvate/2-oxoglutarate dehydrogenase complex dihydrolipoamide dehydrogenase (E3) component
MRSSDAQSTNGQYCNYPAATIVEFTVNNEVVLKLEKSDERVVVRASCVVVLIGSRPNLEFLGDDEREIGRVPGVAIDGKRNPVDVDAYTYQSNRRPGLYAIGPLVGDNFVRFLRGGAVGVAAHIWSKREQPDQQTSCAAE